MPRTAFELAVQYAVPRAGLPAATSLRSWARAACKQSASVSLRIVDRREGRQVNARYRGRDYATNVLSFPYGRDDGRLTGDVLLCAPVIAREAKEQGKLLRAHYAHLVVHAMLHLQGLDHGKPTQALKMEALEVAILARLGFANPYLAWEEAA